ncbi:Maf family protein [Amphibiibacter pelophylacis]|uniref:Maf family protein n=1 Tax=Amphibiibacter pelophylacis TaxID=1799477 RepID=A0ACC6P342_9BURK
MNSADLTPPALLLASGSRYRQALLRRLGCAFGVLSPDIDESLRPGEAVRDAVQRLAQEKAQAVAALCERRWPGRLFWIIAGDQLADLDGQALGKPGSHERAVAQLRQQSGRTVLFHSALHLIRLDADGAQQPVAHLDSVAVRFRALDDASIERYLRIEQPYDCAGSAKCEGLGIALLESITTLDPTALEGLSLIAVRRLLATLDFDVLAQASAGPLAVVRLQDESPADAPVLGRLVLVPNALDLGSVTQPLQGQLPPDSLAQAARLRHWVVENARSARQFLARVQASQPLAARVQDQQIIELPRPPKGRPGAGLDAAQIEALLAPTRAGHDVGLLSEAGLPAVADPGCEVVAAAHRLGLTVHVLPGSNAMVLALAGSGLPGQSFAFAGYLPVDAQERRTRILALQDQAQRLGQSQLVMDTPYRNRALLQALIDTLAPTAWLAAACGLTLPQACVRAGAVAQWRTGKHGLTLDALPLDLPAVMAFGAAGSAVVSGPAQAPPGRKPREGSDRRGRV